jgi:hypothetical protein
MKELAKSVTDLIRGTAIENNELELAKLRELPLEEQIEVGIVLRTAMLRGKEHPELGNGELGEVRSVAEAQRLLDKASEAHPHCS